MLSPLARPTIYVALAFLPSGKTVEDLITHLSPSADQVPSPKAPESSKLHERIRLACGSQPIHCLALPTATSLTVVEKLPTMKFRVSVHESDTCSTAPSVPSLA